MNGRTFGLAVPPTILLWILIAVLVIAGLRYSAYGRYIYAIGGNRRSARLIGVSEFKYWTLAYTLSGGFAALTGALLLAGVAVDSSASEILTCSPRLLRW